MKSLKQLQDLRSKQFEKGNYNLATELSTIINQLINDRHDLKIKLVNQASTEKLQLIETIYKSLN